MTGNNIRSLFSVSEVELVYRSKDRTANRPKVTTAQQAYDIFMAHWDMNKIDLVEHVKMLLLSRSGACLGISPIAAGGMADCPVDPKIIFATALKKRASNIVLAHNHPSGSLKPSKADELVTQRLRDGGNLLDIRLNDHLIVTPTHYFSFAEAGLVL